MTKKVIGVASSPWNAVNDAESKLPYPIKSTNYLALTTSEPKLIDQCQFMVEITYVLKEDQLPSKEEITGLVRKLVDEALKGWFKEK